MGALAGLDVLPAFHSVYDHSQMWIQEHTVPRDEINAGLSAVQPWYRGGTLWRRRGWQRKLFNAVYKLYTAWWKIHPPPLPPLCLYFICALTAGVRLGVVWAPVLADLIEDIFHKPKQGGATILTCWRVGWSWTGGLCTSPPLPNNSFSVLLCKTCPSLSPCLCYCPVSCICSNYWSSMGYKLCILHIKVL